MATQSSYTTVKVSRFGFSVLSITLDRVHTDKPLSVATGLIADAVNAGGDDYEFINQKWKESLANDDKYVSFSIEAGGDARDDFHVSIRHFDITDEQVRLALNTSRDVEVMFF